MEADIKVKVGHVELKGVLYDTECGKAVLEALPLRTDFERWGEEFYFSIGIKKSLDETACKVVEVGTVGYWPPGDALAVFFGPTPTSTDKEPVAASEVNIVGELYDASELKKVQDAVEIVMEKA